MNYTLNKYGYGAAGGVTMPKAEWEELREELRLLREERADLRAALSFAASVIRSGEPWTAACEEKIGRALAKG